MQDTNQMALSDTESHNIIHFQQRLSTHPIARLKADRYIYIIVKHIYRIRSLDQNEIN